MTTDFTETLHGYAGFLVGCFIFACAVSQACRVSSTNPKPLHEFCPLQSLRALLHADCPLQVFTPTQLSVASVAAAVVPTNALLKSIAAAVAIAAPLPLFNPMACSSLIWKTVRAASNRARCDTQSVDRLN